MAIVLAAVLLGGIVLYLAFGRAEQSAEERITADLVARGLPRPLAACMGRELTARLSLPQLAKLRRLEPGPGEAEVPMNAAELIERLRRIDDPVVVETGARVAAICALRHGL